MLSCTLAANCTYGTNSQQSMNIYAQPVCCLSRSPLTMPRLLDRDALPITPFSCTSTSNSKHSNEDQKVWRTSIPCMSLQLSSNIRHIHYELTNAITERG